MNLYTSVRKYDMYVGIGVHIHRSIHQTCINIIHLGVVPGEDLYISQMLYISNVKP